MNLKIGENYPRRCFWTKEKETRVKFNPGLTANRPSNNWALVPQTSVILREDRWWRRKMSAVFSGSENASIKQTHFPLVILLPLRPASPAHKNPQRRKIIHGMRPVGGKDRSIDQNNCFVEIICSCNYCGSYYGCCLTMHISLSIFYALK